MLSQIRNTSKFFRILPSTYAPSYNFSVNNQGEKSSDEDVVEKVSRSTKIKTPKQLKNVALVLSGCGVNDGSEITEAVSFLISFGSRKIKYQCFAPNKDQVDVINHLTGQPQNEKRNVLVKAARIARGNIKDLKELTHDEFDAIFLPGGFGAAKNLSNFASKGADLTVDPEMERVLRDFHSHKKPIALACISPIIAAKVFGQSNKVKITLGNKGEGWPYQGSIDAAEKLGATHSAKSVSSYCADTRNLVFTSPAFMKETTNFHEIYSGIDNLVGGVNETLKELKEKEKAKREERKLKRQENQNQH